jgi:membrane associated rhomboid family serine protease
MTDRADEGVDARGRATLGAVAEQWVTVATGLSEALANELALVLTARGVPFRRGPGVRGFDIAVPLTAAPAAATELALYHHENTRKVGTQPLEEIGDGRPGAIAYVVTLLAVFVALHADLFLLDWLGAGRFDGGAVLGGEAWRLVTALTLHIELAHLGGNIAFGAFYGYFVGRYLGTGVGWLTVILAAAAGNGLNALVQAATHRSIGASTAVFAALGLLVAYTWRRGFLTHTPWRARIAPIVAGLGLLAFTGTGGENTDLGAHLFGLVAGFGAGLVLARFVPVVWLKSTRVQRVSAAAAVLVVLGAWAVALLA